MDGFNRFNPEGSVLRLHQMKMLRILEFVDREVADRILSLIILEIITVNRLRCAIGGELLSFISIWPEEREMRSLRLFLCH